jgi:regulator of nucleoside diphosphate kinase
MSTDNNGVLDIETRDGYEPCPRCGYANGDTRLNGRTPLADCARLPCVLTSHNFTYLHEYTRDRLAVDDPLRKALLVKLAHAHVFAPPDVGDDIATLDSRLTFLIKGSARESRVLVKPDTPLTFGRDLPVLSPLGLALLGLATGQTSLAFDHLGAGVPLQLVSVNYQPEAAHRKRPRRA